MYMASPLSLLLLFFTIQCTLVLGQLPTEDEDFRITITHNAINGLLVYGMPVVEAQVLGFTFPEQSIEGAFDIEVSTIGLRSFNLDTNLSFDATSQTIRSTINDLTMQFYPFRFSASKSVPPFGDFYCNSFVEFNFTSWALAFSLQVVTDGDCRLRITTLDDSIDVTRGEIGLGFDFHDGRCDTMIAETGYLVDIETIIEDMIMTKLPETLAEDFEIAVNKFLYRVGYFQQIDTGVCFNVFNITEDELVVAGSFVIEDNEIDLYWDTEATLGLEMDLPMNAGPEYTIPLLLFGGAVLAMLCGGCCSYALCHCRHKAKKKRKSSKITARMMEYINNIRNE